MCVCVCVRERARVRAYVRVTNYKKKVYQSICLLHTCTLYAKVCLPMIIMMTVLIFSFFYFQFLVYFVSTMQVRRISIFNVSYTN